MGRGGADNHLFLFDQGNIFFYKPKIFLNLNLSEWVNNSSRETLDFPSQIGKTQPDQINILWKCLLHALLIQQSCKNI